MCARSSRWALAFLGGLLVLSSPTNALVPVSWTISSVEHSVGTSAFVGRGIVISAEYDGDSGTGLRSLRVRFAEILKGTRVDQLILTPQYNTFEFPPVLKPGAEVLVFADPVKSEEHLEGLMPFAPLLLDGATRRTLFNLQAITDARAIMAVARKALVAPTTQETLRIPICVTYSSGIFLMNLICLKDERLEEAMSRIARAWEHRVAPDRRAGVGELPG